MNQRITNFINDNKIASLCCVDKDNVPYCFHCFYAFNEEYSLLLFKSSQETHHSRILKENPAIAGSILPEKSEILALKGIQFTGNVLSDFPAGFNPGIFYHRKFPFALAKSGDIYTVQLNMIKMTDNTNIFGQKLVWSATETA